MNLDNSTELLILNKVCFTSVKYVIGGMIGFFILLLPTLSIPASQEQVDPNLVPESDVVLQKAMINMNIPDNPKLPWGCVWGKVDNPAPGYPVEIEIFQDGKPVYFAQTDVKPDGSYEHYFRVTSVSDGKVLHIFKGDYTVLVFKYEVNTTISATST